MRPTASPLSKSSMGQVYTTITTTSPTIPIVRHRSSYMWCHVNASEYFGGVPRWCVYENANVVVLGRDAGGRCEWNSRMLDFALRVGFELRLCRPYCAQTSGKVESGVKYVRSNLWPTVRFSDDAEKKRPK